jgi:hypothetical protein
MKYFKKIFDIFNPVIFQARQLDSHSRLSGIRRHTMLKTKKDSGQAGMTAFKQLHAGLITTNNF